MGDAGRIRYLFTGQIEERDGSYVVEIPEREIEDGGLTSGEETRLGVFSVEGQTGDGPVATATVEEESGNDGRVSETVTDATKDGDVGAATGDGGTATDSSTTSKADGDGDAGATGMDSGVGEETDDRAEAGSGDGAGSQSGASSFESLDEVSLDEEEPPVSVGDTRRVEITDVGEQGDGLARIDRGYIVFVPETEPGDTVQIEITDAKENFGFGKVVE